MLTLSTILFNKITRPVVSAVSSSKNLSTSSGKETANKMSGEDLSTVMFVLGGPGAGKGTQCTNLVKVIQILFSKIDRIDLSDNAAAILKSM